MRVTIKAASALTTAIALSVCSIVAASPIHQAAASSGDGSAVTAVKAQYYPCLQGPTISVPTGLAPNAPAPLDLLKKLLAAPMHQNGRMCATFTGGTAAQRHSAVVAFRASQSQGGTTITPFTCTGNDTKYTSLLETVNGDSVSVVTHWRLNANCTHTFYNNQYSFNSEPNALWVQGTQVCDSSNTYCTNFANAGMGCWSIPTTVNFSTGGLGDPDLRYWQSEDQYATVNNVGCRGLTNATASFTVDTSG